MAPGFNPTRLVLARERRGLFSKQLADRCGVTPQTISNWESGRTEPGEAIAVLSEALGFPPAFFFRSDLDRLPEGAATFRARTRVPARQKRAAIAASDLVRELADWIESHFELPPVRLPDLEGQDPELAAKIIRQEWLLGEKPIPNMVQLLESRGVLVFSLAQDCLEIDAFSFWSGSRPMVLLNTQKSAERSRMDAAHELFHLLAHKEETGKKEEMDANTFGGALLMPENDLRRRIPRAVGLNQLIERKQRWGVSLAALVYRLHKIGIVSDWQYRSLFVELSKRGYRSREPNPGKRDTSRLLSLVFESLKEKGVGVRQVASELGWSRPHLQEFLLGLGAAMMAIDGEGDQGGSPRRAKLRLVE